MAQNQAAEQDKNADVYYVNCKGTILHGGTIIPPKEPDIYEKEFKKCSPRSPGKGPDDKDLEKASIRDAKTSRLTLMLFASITKSIY